MGISIGGHTAGGTKDEQKHNPPRWHAKTLGPRATAEDASATAAATASITFATLAGTVSTASAGLLYRGRVSSRLVRELDAASVAW